jgi:hypothetical protein
LHLDRASKHSTLRFYPWANRWLAAFCNRTEFNMSKQRKRRKKPLLSLLPPVQSVPRTEPFIKRFAFGCRISRSSASSTLWAAQRDNNRSCSLAHISPSSTLRRRSPPGGGQGRFSQPPPSDAMVNPGGIRAVTELSFGNLSQSLNRPAAVENTLGLPLYYKPAGHQNRTTKFKPSGPACGRIARFERDTYQFLAVMHVGAAIGKSRMTPDNVPSPSVFGCFQQLRLADLLKAFLGELP